MVTNTEIKDQLDRIEKKLDVASNYSWYFLGLVLMVSSGTFAIVGRYVIAFSFFVIGIILTFTFWYKSHKIEKKLH